MRLIVKSRVWAQRFNDLAEPHVIVSIHTPGDAQARPKRNDYTRAVVFLCFDDLDRVPEPGAAVLGVLSDPVLFDSAMADGVIRAIGDRMPIGTVVVHCDAGVSRSAGMAAALAKHFDGDDSEFFKKGSGSTYSSLGQRYCPNMHVYRVMLEALEA